MTDQTSNQPVRPPRQAGFTLLELLVTISVAAILVAVAIPGLTTFVQNSRDDSEADSLISSLQYARSEAVKRDANVEVCASSDEATCNGGTAWNTGWIVETVAAPPAAAEVLQAIPALGGGNTLSGTLNGGPVSEVTFQPNGFDAAAGGVGNYSTTYFKLCDSRGAKYARDVEITGIGSIQASPTPGQTLDSPPKAIGCP